MCAAAWIHEENAVECNKAAGVARAKHCMPPRPAFAQVYENVTFGGVKHLRIADEEGMFERTVTVCSASKLFSLTGGRGVFAAVVGPVSGGVLMPVSTRPFSAARTQFGNTLGRVGGGRGVGGVTALAFPGGIRSTAPPNKSSPCHALLHPQRSSALSLGPRSPHMHKRTHASLALARAALFFRRHFSLKPG